MATSPKSHRATVVGRRARGLTTRRHKIRVSAAKLKVLESRPEPSARELRQIDTDARRAFASIESVHQLIRSLREVRQQQGLSLAQIDARTGIGRSNLSRLENLRVPNPTFDTLMRYARAVGVTVRLERMGDPHRSAA